MVKHTQTIRREIADEFFLSVFDHFVGLALKGLSQMLCVDYLKVKTYLKKQTNLFLIFFDANFSYPKAVIDVKISLYQGLEASSTNFVPKTRIFICLLKLIYKDKNNSICNSSYETLFTVRSLYLEKVTRPKLREKIPLLQK